MPCRDVDPMLGYSDQGYSDQVSYPSIVAPLSRGPLVPEKSFRVVSGHGTESGCICGVHCIQPLLIVLLVRILEGLALEHDEARDDAME